MKKKIVITLELSENSWTGTIHGLVGEKRTDKIKTSETYTYADSVTFILVAQIHKIVKWMEQIS